MKKLHYLLIHAYAIAALVIAAYFAADQIGYQHAVIFMMRQQAKALAEIAHTLGGTIT